MLFPEEDAPLLKEWIVRRLEDTSDADAEVLAEYIIALLKHDGTRDEVRKLCEAEILDFLTEDPKAFLDDVFQAIIYKSYVPGAPPPPKLPAAAALPSKPMHSNGNGNGNNRHRQQQQQQQAPMPRKRGYRDVDAPGGAANETITYADYQHQRPTKQPRRQPEQSSLPPPPPPPPPPGGIEFNAGMPSPYDPENNPMTAFFSSMGIPPFPGLPPFPPLPGGGRGRGGRGGKRNRRCRDFDTKGYCERASTCMFEHGPTDPGASMPMDMEDPTATAAAAAAAAAFAAQLAGGSGRNGNNRRGKGGGGRRGGGGGGSGSGGRAAFSAEGPVHDRTRSTIVVENIPEENFSEEQVRGFFSQFGNVVDVSMRAYKHLAVVKYDRWSSANAAYQSPKVIFDNRFVKVFWYKDGVEMEDRNNNNNNNNNNNRATPSSTAAATAEKQQQQERSEEPEMDPEEFKRRQEEAQRQHVQREEKRLEIERQRIELERKQQDLMDRHRQEAAKLHMKLREKNGTANGQTGGAGGGGTTDMLLAKLADLEHEAKMLGIDPNAADDDNDRPAHPHYPSRGGWRGRGGAASRGATSTSWRGGRGGGHVAAVGPLDVGARHASYAQYSLDNRPRRLAVTGADFSVAESDEILRHFLLNLGEFESVEPSSSTTYVSFRDRKTAEKLYYSLDGKELPGVEGKLQLSWVNNGTTGNSTSTSTSTHHPPPPPSSSSFTAGKPAAASAVANSALPTAEDIKGEVEGEEGEEGKDHVMDQDQYHHVEEYTREHAEDEDAY